MVAGDDERTGVVGADDGEADNFGVAPFLHYGHAHARDLGRKRDIDSDEEKQRAKNHVR